MIGVLGDTIVAVSSPPGRSMRGLVRLTGPDAIGFLKRCLGLKEIEPRRLVCGRLVEPLSLPVLVSVFCGPRSYTGEDMAEIQCPGNQAILEGLLHYFVGLGARLAEGGEFTYRAYTGGKIDLTQAEGVMATIAAYSDSQLDAASQLREGYLGVFARDCVEGLSLQLALVEAGIDFVDQEDVVPIGALALGENLALILEALHRVQRHSQSWGALEALARVVLVGDPSVGKSTLFNRLLGRERAVISAMPGTTRDVLIEPWLIPCADGQMREVMLTDIAGLGYEETLIDERAQEAGRGAIAGADVVIYVHARAGEVDLGVAFGGELIEVVSKADVLSEAELGEASGLGMLAVSSLTGRGLEELRGRVVRSLSSQTQSATGQRMALQPRHERAIASAVDALEEVMGRLKVMGDDEGLADVELIASGLRFALDELAMLGGEMTPDDVIGKVFSSFCVGK